MRTFFLLTLSLLSPYALYTAGCNQNRQAAFPTTPEMEALARAPEKSESARPPVIPEIDREILASANNVDSRLQAVNDRSNAYAHDSRPGLFALPPESRGTASAPVPSAREFWSRPAEPAAPRDPSLPMAEDVFAMAAGSGHEPLPEPITIGPAVPVSTEPLVTQSYPIAIPLAQTDSAEQIMMMAPPVGMRQPPRTSAPAGPNPLIFVPPPEQPYQLRPGEKLLPPEHVPGTFMGTDAESAIFSAAPDFAAPISAGNGFDAVPPLAFPATRATAAGRESGIFDKGDPGTAPSTKAPPAVPGSPSILPAANAKSDSAAPFAPRPSRRLEALLKNDDVARALAPLPAIAPAKPATPKLAPSAPAGMLMPPPPGAPDGNAALSPFSEMMPSAPPIFPALPPPPSSVEPPDAADGLKPPADFVRAWEQTLSGSGSGVAVEPAEAPKRITLKPARAKQELRGIDSTVDAPPMKF